MNNHHFLINNQKNYDSFFQPDNILNGLKRKENGENLGIFRKLLTCPSEVFKSSWEPVLLELLTVIADKEGHINEKRLASQTFSTIIVTSCSIDEQKSYLDKVLKLDNSKLCILGGEVDIMEVESFKLMVVYGYLVCNNNTAILSNILASSFGIIHKYCMTYTKHVHFSFKLLEIWLTKSRDIGFWNDCDCETEKKLEEIIFSNWDNCINEVAKINALQLFPLYLEIMQNKYAGFLEYALTTTVNHMSWQNPTKYVIITEIYKIAHDYPKIPHLELNIFQSLSKSHLRHVGTKLYITLMEKMDEDRWNNLMRKHVYVNAKKLEFEDNAGALYVLWELWMKPTLMKFRESLVPSLWVQFCTDGTMRSASYIAKISSELGMSWTQLNSQSLEALNDDHLAAITRYWSKCEATKVPCIIDVTEDDVKLNVFVAYCHMKDFLNKEDDYELCKRFLYCNANTCTSQLRKGLFDNFKILFERMIKIRGKAEISFVSWLYYFIFDCFEPGSCYQRKIIGLKLYETILMYTSGSVNCGRKKTRKHFQDGILLKEQMKKARKWEMDSKFSLFILLKLCLDPIEEIRTQSFNIINNYFDMNVLTATEMDTLRAEADKMNRSSKFYEIDGGVKLTLIVQKAVNSSDPYGFYAMLYKYAKASLAFMKQDVLRALSEGSDFNSSLTVLLESKFPGAGSSLEDFLGKLLDLMKKATKFFLSALSPEASAVTYSSSFAEMGIAIEEKIKTSTVVYEFDENSMSPAHQVLLSYIWMALKILCDLAAKISTTTRCHDKVKSSLDLIVSVLMKCRHKGAIEAAGVALGISMRYLTNMQEHHRLIESYLDKILSLSSEDKIDLTRRGAGLSIMFHAMISNDDKNTRRLLHMAVMRLMKSLRDPTIKSDAEMDSNQDSVCARQLHFLRAIVADKTLHCHLVAYLEEISMICFEHLESREWAIRNGSLQLLGALIPRLVGQSSESELDFGNGYSVNHFFTHYPILADFILREVNSAFLSDVNSKMVAIVTLISKMSVGGCDFTDYSSQEYAVKLKNAMRSLFGHTVDHVRYSAAKAYAALVPIREIPQELLNMKMEKVERERYNFIHGHLMAQVCLHSSAERAGVWSDTFPNNEQNMAMLVKGGMIQLQRFRSLLEHYKSKRPKLSLCHTIEAMFLQCFRLTQVRCKANYAIFREVISFTQFFEIAFCTTAEWECTGVSNFVEQMYKLDPFIPDWESAFGRVYAKDPLLRFNRWDCISDCRYYSLKHLREHIIEEYLQKNGSPYIFMELIEFLYTYIRIQIANHRNVAEICHMIILVLIHCKSSCSASDFEYYVVPDERHWYQPHEILDAIKRIYINPEVHHLVNQIRLLMSRGLGGFLTADRRREITHAIDRGDELSRIWGIDILMCLMQEHAVICDSDGLLLESFIGILSDESSEVHEALYKKMREQQWPNFFYYCCLDYEVPLSCNFCEHSKFGHMKSLIPKNLKLCLHYAIQSHGNWHYPVSLRNVHKWLPQIEEHRDTSVNNKLESPFDHDETYREITKTFNICYHYRTFPSEIPPLKPYDYNDIIMCSDNLLKDYITHRSGDDSNILRAVLQSKVIDYLQYKAEVYEEKYFPNFNRSNVVLR